VETQEAAGSGTAAGMGVFEAIRRAGGMCYGDPRAFLGMSALIGSPFLLAMLLGMARDPKATMSPGQGFIGLLVLILMIAGAILVPYFFGALPVLAAHRLDERPLGWTEAFSWLHDRELFWPIVLVGLLSGLAVLGGLILLVVPGFIFATWLMFAVPARVLSDRPGRQALSESRHVASPEFKRSLGLLLMLLLPMIVVSVAVNVPCAVRFGLFDNSPARIIPPAVANYLLTVLWGPVAGTALSLFYIDRSGGLPGLREDIFY